MPDYPLRLFFERLKLWYRVYDDGVDEPVRPLVAGRLQGKAQRLSYAAQVGKARQYRGRGIRWFGPAERGGSSGPS